MKIKIIDISGNKYEVDTKHIPKNAKITSVTIRIPAYFSGYKPKDSGNLKIVFDIKKGGEK